MQGFTHGTLDGKVGVAECSLQVDFNGLIAPNGVGRAEPAVQRHGQVLISGAQSEREAAAHPFGTEFQLVHVQNRRASGFSIQIVEARLLYAYLGDDDVQLAGWCAGIDTGFGA